MSYLYSKLRPYQKAAVDELIKIAIETNGLTNKAFASRIDDQIAKAEKPEGQTSDDVRKTVLVYSHTGSGKTFVATATADILEEDFGIMTLALSPYTTIAEQNADMGLTSITTQAMFRAVKACGVTKKGTPARSIKWHAVAKQLGLPEDFFRKKIAFMVDESHWAFETKRNLYRRVFDLFSDSKVAIIIGFTATPVAPQGYRIIDIRDDAVGHVAKPLGSIILSQTLHTVPYALSIFPTPGLIFTRNVLSASLVTLAFKVARNDESARLVVANAKLSLADSARRLFRAVDSGQSQTDDDDSLEETLNVRGSSAGVNQRIDMDTNIWSSRGNASINVHDAPLDPFSRRLGMLVLCLVMDEISRMPNRLKEWRYFCLKTSLIPSFSQSLRLIDHYKPSLSQHLRRAVALRDLLGIDSFAKAVGEIQIPVAQNPATFVRSGAGFGVSVFKVGTGFNFPLLRSVVMAQSVSNSPTLYTQRAGRGSRIVGDKKYYDLIELQYIDPSADPSLGRLQKKVSWLTHTTEKSPDEGSNIMKKMVIFREPYCKLPGD